MRDVLKQSIMQQFHIIERDFKRLDLSVMPWTALQLSSLDTLRESIQRLKITISRLPVSDLSLDAARRQDINSQLAVMVGFTQMLLYKQVGELGVAAAKSLQNILNAGYCIQDMLEEDKDMMKIGA